MIAETQSLFEQATRLPPLERAHLIEHLLSTLGRPDERIDELWRAEVDDRVRAVREGKIETVSLQDVLAKYRQ